jgi:hypothetical protein
VTFTEGVPRDKVEASPAPAVERHAGSGVRRYEPPTLTEKKALEEVTLFSFACAPGDPTCSVGHP